MLVRLPLYFNYEFGEWRHKCCSTVFIVTSYLKVLSTANLLRFIYTKYECLYRVFVFTDVFAKFCRKWTDPPTCWSCHTRNKCYKDFFVSL